MEEDAAAVADFLEQHNAIMILSNKANRRTNHVGSLLLRSDQDSSQESVQNYFNSLVEFDRLQREKEVASAKTLSCGDPKKDEQAILQFEETLDYVVACKEEPLCHETLVRWHLWLMGDGLHEEAGNFRDYTLERDGTRLCPPEQIHDRVEKFCHCMESSWLPQVDANPNAGKEIASFAAAVLIGILDISPYHDEHNRFALIAVTWAFRRCGLPFHVHLFNDGGRQDFDSVLNATMQNLYRIPVEEVEDADILRVLEGGGGLAPLTNFLLSCLACAVRDLIFVIREKAKWTTEEHHARIVRKAREEAVETVCFVCFEGLPNISTLCCGKPVHFNCMAEWLSSHASCPQCRSSIPVLRTKNSTPFEPPPHDADEGDSEVERLLSYVTNDPVNDSSSDSWPSSSSSSSDSSSEPSSDSSSSSSFSTNSALLYDELAARFVPGSSDDDEGEREVDGSSHYRWVSENEDESDEQHFFNANLAPVEVVDVEVHGVVSGTHLVDEEETGRRNDDSSLSTSVSHSVRAREIFRLDSDSGSEARFLRDGTRSNIPIARESFSTPVATPRMTFLDPALLGNVQQGNCRQEVGVSSGSVDSSSTGDDSHDEDQLHNETFLFAINPAMRTISPDSAITAAHWLSPRQYDDSETDGYDPGRVDDEEFFFPEEHESGRSAEDPPALCLQPLCHNHAHAECCSSRCYSCCVKLGAHCPVHAGRFTSSVYQRSS